MSKQAAFKPREAYPGDTPTGKRRRFLVTVSKTVEVSLDTSVLMQGTMPDNPIRVDASENFVIEHVAYNLIVNDLQLSAIDGYANCPDESASLGRAEWLVEVEEELAPEPARRRKARSRIS
jgi:hypothetical protein